MNAGESRESVRRMLTIHMYNNGGLPLAVDRKIRQSTRIRAVVTPRTNAGRRLFAIKKFLNLQEEEHKEKPSAASTRAEFCASRKL